MAIKRPMLLAGAASTLAGIAMLPFLAVQLLGSAMGEDAELRTPFDLLVTNHALRHLETAVLVVWLLLPVCWLALGIAFIRARQAGTAHAKVLCLFAVILGAVSLVAYGWVTGFLFLPPALLSCWHIALSEHQAPGSAPSVQAISARTPDA